MVSVVREALSKHRAGVALVSIGITLLFGVGAYYAYSAIARSDLDGLNYEIETPIFRDTDGSIWQFDEGALIEETIKAPEPIKSATVQDETYGGTVYRNSDKRPDLIDNYNGKPDSELDRLPNVSGGSSPEVAVQVVESEADSASSSDTAETDSIISFDAGAYVCYPTSQIDPKYWDNPTWVAPPDPRIEASEAEAASYTESPSSGIVVDTSSATRIRISAIDVDSGVKDLEIIDLGDSRSYETPNNIVGHIPATATPGEQGQGWYFGHLESPIRGEGNVFKKLPEIPELLRKGEEIYVFIETTERKYAYKVYKTEVLPQEELRLADSGNQEITLVACVPRLVYDHRILVTAALVGVKDL